MPAEVLPLARGWQVWCEEHQDGINCKTRMKAQGWADIHNAKRHPEEEVEPIG